MMLPMILGGGKEEKAFYGATLNNGNSISYKTKFGMFYIYNTSNSAQYEVFIVENGNCNRYGRLTTYYSYSYTNDTLSITASGYNFTIYGVYLAE